ncbi:MAG: beta-lactamase family protein [Proteobacteria bacterium]|nr:beta-lactamase family protein [Pseudomonadota bacterium]
MKTTRIEEMMNQAIDEGVFPGGILLASVEGNLIFHKGFGVTKIHSGVPVTDNIVFDLASLTKPLATTLAVMKLMARGLLQLTDSLGDVLPDFKNTDKAWIAISQLLNHTSGLPAYQPYFEKLICFPEKVRKEKLHALLADEPLIHPPGGSVQYSDIGFMILSWIVETISGMRLDLFLEQEIYGPLEIVPLFFPGMKYEKNVPDGRSHYVYAATENCPWRKRLLEGVVHDDNAYASGGIAGHAGLFGTARAVFDLLRFLLSVYKGNSGRGIVDKHVLRIFFAPQPGTGRALGFDLPSKIGSSSGRYFSDTSVGHLGFTGTSFWMDLDREIIVVLLTNRVHPSRSNEKIKIFRPKIHDVVLETIISSKKNFKD